MRISELGLGHSNDTALAALVESRGSVDRAVRVGIETWFRRCRQRRQPITSPATNLPLASVIENNASGLNHGVFRCGNRKCVALREQQLRLPANRKAPSGSHSCTSDHRTELVVYKDEHAYPAYVFSCKSVVAQDPYKRPLFQELAKQEILHGRRCGSRWNGPTSRQLRRRRDSTTTRTMRRMPDTKEPLK